MMRSVQPALAGGSFTQPRGERLIHPLTRVVLTACRRITLATLAQAVSASHHWPSRCRVRPVAFDPRACRLLVDALDPELRNNWCKCSDARHRHVPISLF